jgi:hypothetical protein
MVILSTWRLRQLLGAELVAVPAANDATESKTDYCTGTWDTSAGQSQAVASCGSHSNSEMIYWMLGWHWRGTTGGCEPARHVR